MKETERMMLGALERIQAEGSPVNHTAIINEVLPQDSSLTWTLIVFLSWIINFNQFVLTSRL